MPASRPALLHLPRDAVRPDYRDGGLFGLMRSVRRFLDGGPWVLPGTPAAEEPPAGAAPVLVFLLIDGLGDAFVRRFGAGTALLAHRVRRVTSVFPSTTASAVTTALTAVAPAAHGLTGWFVRDRRFGGVVAPLPMRTRRGSPFRGPAQAERLFPRAGLFDDTRRAAVFVNPRSLAHSGYSRRHGRGAAIVPYRGLDHMLTSIVESVATLGARGGGYVHAYYPMFDALSHMHGCHSERVVAEFLRIDAAFTTLLERLDGSGAQIVASADHGFIDSPPQRVVHLEREPDVREMLAAPLFGERRAAFCEVRPGAERDFEDWGAKRLANKAVLVESARLLRAGFFGPGPRHPRLRERVGTHALLMEPGWTVVDRVPGERPPRMLGVHGGLSPQEMWVPLISATC